MKSKILIAVFCLLNILLQAQSIENVRFEQEGKKINVYYDMTGTGANQKYDISVYCSTDGGKTWGSPIQSVTGSVGTGQTSGYNKKITWNVLADRDKLSGDIMFEIKAIPERGSGIEMVFVQGGTFQMGCTSGQSGCSDDEKPVHTVTVNNFYLSKYEVTHKQFIKFLNEMRVNANGSYRGKEYIDMDDKGCAIGYISKFYFKGSKYVENENCPVIEVTWYGANAFCEWAGGRLLTEAEWEYAARGGNRSKGYKYAGSSNLNEVAWYYKNSQGKTHPVGKKLPNELGLYDMSGNVWEWCNDWYGSKYYSSSRYNPEGAASGSYRVLRGGSWNSDADCCRMSNRYWSYPDISYDFIGFRLARD